MSFQGSSSTSSALFHILSFVLVNPRIFSSHFMLTIIVFVLLVGCLPYTSCSSTKLSNPMNNNNNNHINDNENVKKSFQESNVHAFHLNDYHSRSKRDLSTLLPSIREQPFAELPSSLFRFAQPRIDANQFLTSHVNDNDFIVPKRSTQSNKNEDYVDVEDYRQSGTPINKRLVYYDARRYSTMNKHKKLTKPPMEVMNEIVNSIYLKRQTI